MWEAALGIAGIFGCMVWADGAPATRMKITERWALPGPTAFDYLTLDSSGSHLFVTRGTQVDVLDTHSGKVIATIPNTRGAHGVALAEDMRRGYVSNGKADTVTMFDLDSYKILGEAPVSGHNPDAIVYDPMRHHLFTFNGRSSDVSVLSPKDLTTEKTIGVPGKPEFAVMDEHGKIFANIETDPGQLVVIDPERLEVQAVWKLEGCNSPSGLAIDRTHHRLFSVCDNHVMMVVDATTGKTVTRMRIGGEPDAVAYDARRSLVISSNGEGTLSIIHQDTTDRYRNSKPAVTQKGSRTMALDSASGAVYLTSANFAVPTGPGRGRPQALDNSFAILKMTW